MRGFDSLVWMIVLVQAGGGLLVAVVLRFADNLLKAMATSIAIVLSSALAFVLFALAPRALFAAGAALVVGAVFLYNLCPMRTAEAIVTVDNDDTSATAIASKLNERDASRRAAARHEAEAVWDAIALTDDVPSTPTTRYS